MKTSPQTRRTRNTRWFLFLNTSIAVVLVCAAVLLTMTGSRFERQSQMDQTYLAMTRAEQDSATLQHGILHTEAARANAYRSLSNVSNGASIIWVLVAIAFIMNAVFIFRMNRNHQLNLAEAVAA